ncbi:prepilin-type N-terminal cleavage/methylation domain-containing protein [bacterium]|nr:prepilin-type N-terminal cleavage/methylation domain-containing protein [bacterium]
MRKTNGFSLIELMIALGIMTIIATVSVPRVQVWNARNRGLQTVMELLSDFSKARSVAGYTVVGTGNNSINIPVNVDDDSEGAATMPVYMGVRRQTAMVFRKSEYAIYQKQSMDTSTWDASALMLKKNNLLNTITIEKVNGTDVSASTTNFGNLLNFNSNGKVKTKGGYFVSGADSEYGKCGSAVAKNTLPNIVFSAIVRSKVSSGSNDSIWYRLDIDQRGEYSICTLFSDKTSVDYSDFAGSSAVLLDM